MTILSGILSKVLTNNFKGLPCVCTYRSLNYSPINYDGKEDPAPLFFNDEIQSLLKALTRVNYSKVFRSKKLGREKLAEPKYKFMTDQELKAAMKEAQRKSNVLLQIPPIVKVRKPISKILSRDPALKGLETSRFVFTDITFGINNTERLIVVREPDGTLQEAEPELRQRINQAYFPAPGRSIKTPLMFQDNYLESLLDRHEYEFILDRCCTQFEPADPEYQRIVSITYQHLNDHNQFEPLRSTRHFGALAFFLAWNKIIDNLLLELIETSNVNDAEKLIALYSHIHGVKFEGNSDLDLVEDFVKKAANKKGALELAIQAYKDLAKQRQNLEQGIKLAHGLEE